MIDSYGRDINYVRLSVTDRCNLNCIYCRPNNLCTLKHEEILRFEEYLHILRILAAHGVRHVRVTGGEPFMRKGLVSFISEIKSIDGIQDVSITSNGTLLYDKIPDLKSAGLDSINISLDSCDDGIMQSITGKDNCATDVKKCIQQLLDYHIPVKINSVLIRSIKETIPEMIRFTDYGIPVRFIETMPIGKGNEVETITPDEVLDMLKIMYPDLHAAKKEIGNGPARYYESNALKAPVGFITAISNSFCENCNRIRITSTGQLKPCLCYNDSLDLRELLRSDADDAEIYKKIQSVVNKKRSNHAFNEIDKVTETKLMSEIGG